MLVGYFHLSPFLHESLRDNYYTVQPIYHDYEMLPVIVVDYDELPLSPKSY